MVEQNESAKQSLEAKEAPPGLNVVLVNSKTSELDRTTPDQSPKAALEGTKYDTAEGKNTQRFEVKSAKVIDLSS